MEHNRWKVNERDMTKNVSQHNLKNNATQSKNLTASKHD